MCRFSRYQNRLVWAFAACVVAPGQAFVAVPYSSRSTPSAVVPLWAKKKAASGQGFGKNIETTSPSSSTTSSNDGSSSPTASASQVTTTPTSSLSSSSSSFILQSVQGGSTEKPKTDERSPEERAKSLLREKYGMKTLEEERLSQKDREQLEAQRKKLAALKSKSDDEFDLFTVIPAAFIQGIFTFLQAGLAVSGLAFLLSGLGITLEAWSKASGSSSLPEGMDDFIATVIEPNFTPLLLVLLGFSVSLGVLAAAQLGSKSAQYRED